MQRVFSNGSSHDNRDILIKIEPPFICFYFNEFHFRRQEWIDNETEERSLHGEEPLDEDESSNDGFYHILIKEWVSDKTNRLDRPDNWANHMEEKNWFTHEMKDFINNSTITP